MDLLGDIVEHEPDAETVVPPQPTNFKPQGALAPSRWKQRLQKKGIDSMSGVVTNTTPVEDGKFYKKDSETGLKSFKNSKERKLDYSGLDEKEQIHQENIEILSRMSTEDREEAKQDLLDTLDPAILQMLMNRASRKSPASNPTPSSSIQNIDEPVEGAIGTWVGGEHPEYEKANVEDEETQNKEPKEPKKIRFNEEAKVIYIDQALKVDDIPKAEDNEWEDVEDLNEAPSPDLDDVKRLNDLKHDSQVHFPKPSEPYEELDINDPKFNEKLHAKYFPDLPQNVKQLDWMKETNEIPTSVEYESIIDVRFDFKGDIINSQNVQELSETNTGLHNHSQNPELPGYTLTELAHLLRSTFPGQCCIASRTLGRIMFKLGKLQYQIQEHDDEDDNEGSKNDKGQMGQFEIECWKLIIKLQIIDLLQHYVSDKQRNLSIKNYAIDALWLWKQGGGDEQIKKYLPEDNADSTIDNSANTHDAV